MAVAAPQYVRDTVMRLRNEGTACPNIAKVVGVNRSTVRRWITESGQNVNLARIKVTPRPITTAESVTVYLSAAGAATAESIAEQTGNAVDDVIRVLDSNPDRYDVRGSLYSLNKKYLTRS